MSTSQGCAFVTGASRGIGRGIALELAKAGFDIAGVSRTVDTSVTESGIMEVKGAVEALGRCFLPVAGDIGDLTCHARMIDEVCSEFGSIQLLVNNAGVAPSQRLDILNMTEESYDRVMGINLKGPLFLTQKVASLMCTQREAHPDMAMRIIFITSVSAYVASPNRTEYCVSKAGASMVVKNFASRLAADNIPVYEVRPGIIQTDMTGPVKEKYDALIADGLVPQRRWGFPEDIGRACASLARGDFAFSTGEVFEISGGMQVPVL